MLKCSPAFQCCQVHDWRFKSLPPLAYQPALVRHYISFHKVDPATLQHLHRALRKLHAPNAPSLGPSLGPMLSTLPPALAAAPTELCVPTLPRGAATPVCGPNFVIIGAQKSATTSIFGYLKQHPQVGYPQDTL